MKRSLKKFLYGLLYLTVFGLIVFAIEYSIFAPKPTCSDNLQNQNEEGVDCGGECTPCDIKHLQPLQTPQPYRIFGLAGGRTSLLFGVANPNSTYHAASFRYHIEVYDKSGTKIDDFDGTDTLYAGMKKFIIEPRVSIRSSAIGNTSITLNDPEWRSVEEFAAPQLGLSGITTHTLSDGTVRVVGTASNKSSVPADMVTVIAVVSDGYGKKLFAAQNILTSLVGFENASFTIAFPSDPLLQSIDASKTEVFISSR